MVKTERKEIINYGNINYFPRRFISTAAYQYLETAPDGISGTNTN
jgi:hypothetical protein